MSASTRSHKATLISVSLHNSRGVDLGKVLKAHAQHALHHTQLSRTVYDDSGTSKLSRVLTLRLSANCEQPASVN